MAHIEITDQSPRESYAVTGAQSAFAVPFAFFAFTDLRVFNGSTELTYSVSPTAADEFSVAGTAVDDGYSSGTVTLGASVSDTTITILREVPIERVTDFPYPSPTINIRALNTELDKWVAWAQQIVVKIGRAIVLADSDSTAGLTLPSPAERAGAYLAFGPDGQTIVATGSSPGTVPVSTAMEAVVGAATLAAARTAMGVPGLAEVNAFTHTQVFTASATGGVAIHLDLDKEADALDQLPVIAGTTRNAAGEFMPFGSVVVQVVSPVDGAESGRWGFVTSVAGVYDFRWWLGSGFYAQGLTDPGAGKMNAGGYQLSGAATQQILQTVVASTAAYSSTSATIPRDDTKPQKTEGTELFSQAFTPKRADSWIEIDILVNFETAASDYVAFALFKDDDADAVDVGMAITGGANWHHQVRLSYRVLSGTTDPRTYKVRYGGTTYTTYINGNSSGRLYGGAMVSQMRIREVSP